MAIPRLKKDDGVDFIDVSCWKETADFVDRYIQKGDIVALVGELQQQRWEDKDGNKRSKHIINFAKINYYSRAKANSDEIGEGRNTFTEVYNDIEDSSDLPF